MKTITATELARNLSQVLDALTAKGEEIVVVRNHRQVARIVPGRTHQTALEAMGDLYRVLPHKAAASWLADSRTQPLADESAASVGDPWIT
jgi:antitoxin (DNA-binding transcriptional repressor) of toxin-antitoxin stability system